MVAVVGVDLAAGRGVTEVATLYVEDGDDLPQYRSHEHCRVVSDEEILAAVMYSHPLVVAIDAPLTLPSAVSAGLGTPAGSRIAESMSASPYTRATERDPIWRTVGVRPLPVSFLGGLTFRAIAFLPALRSALPNASIIETFPTGALRCLGISRNDSNQPGQKRVRASKTTSGARHAVQDGLRTYIQGIPDPASELLGADLLDALAAGITALSFYRDTYIAVGDEAEGVIILPTFAP